MNDLRAYIQSLPARDLISLTIFHKTLMEVGTVHDCELRSIAKKFNTSSDPFHILFMLDEVAFEAQQELDRRDDSELHGEWGGGPRYVIRYTNGGYKKFGIQYCTTLCLR